MNFDADFNVAEKLFLLVFFLLYFGVPAMIVWASYCEKCALDMRDLWTNNHRPDKLAVIILGTWWVHTCSMILWTLTQKVTTTDYLTYMGWALPLMVKFFAPAGDTPPKPPETPPATGS